MFTKPCKTKIYQRKAVNAYYARNKEAILERRKLRKEIKKLEEEIKRIENLENEYNELTEN